MRVTWDPVKARANLRKHGIRLSDAEAVLFDPLAISVEDLSARGESRFHATRKERHQYEEGV